MKPTLKEREEYANLVKLKAWGPRYYELHKKIATWDTDMWRQEDVFGERLCESDTVHERIL